MVFVTRSGSSLLVSPWKDGLKPKEIIEDGWDIQNVMIVFQEESSDQDILEEEELVDLFTVIGNGFAKLSSFTISVQSSASPSPSHTDNKKRIIPPLKAITALLNGRNRLRSLTLNQLRLMGHDQEFADFIASVRLHPTLHNFNCMGCVFSKNSRFQHLKAAINSRTKKDVFLDGSIILEYTRVLMKSKDEGWVFSYPLLCCF
jgi:hypothetical protein